MEKKSGHQESDKKLKVRLIDTRYVVVDEKDFKTVVQNLTGKNSSVDWIGSNFANTSCNTSNRELKKNQDDPVIKYNDDMLLSSNNCNKSNSICENDYLSYGKNERDNVRVNGFNVFESSHDISVDVELSSFDIDQMLEDLPLMEDLDQWWQNLSS
ncbi:hypothetical protein RND81_11G166300 [Saponaria officinalis]|uniref:VQ domain-containing protein n=1 Tax=Saponaria officinalis TaxID=3572 RepID=A0AAW1HNH4_SAPOF